MTRLPSDNTKMMNNQKVDVFFRSLQQDICDQLESVDGGAQFQADTWEKPEGGGGRSCVLTDGKVFEQAGVNFSSVTGSALPPSATAKRPELAGCHYKAMGVSLVIHPKNPFVPTTHCNVRYFEAKVADGSVLWWFGGGFDLTPYYPFLEDVKQWHQTAYDVCKPFGDSIYATYKKWCDSYFYLKHRNETRGVGGLFFDDLNEGGFDRCFTLTQAIGQSFCNAYIPIVERRKSTPWSDSHRQFQLYRRGRYVEFNLVYDRGTLFGLQSGGRTESILMSLPPLVSWRYDWRPELGSAEADLYENYLHSRDWLDNAG